MSIGAKWIRAAERVGAEQARRLIEAAERDLSDLLPGARIERGVSELKLSGRRLMRRWLSDPALRFIGRRLK